MQKYSQQDSNQLNQWMALTPPELVQAHLNLTPTVMGALRKQKRPVV